MGFDSRHLVLEFIAENRLLGITQMTLVFFGKKKDPFLQKCFNEMISDKVYVYHNKGTRLFWKEYPFDKLKGTIIELLLDNNASINIRKNDLTFELTEPYYFLDLRKFDFDYLSVIPVKEKEELVGYVLLYGISEITQNKYPNVSLSRLFRNITKNENQAKFQEFDTFFDGIKGYIDFNEQLYLSKILADELKINQKVENPSEFKELLLKQNYVITDSYEKNNYLIYELEQNKRYLKALEELNNCKQLKEFTLFYIRMKSIENLNTMYDKINLVLNEVFPNVYVDLFKVSNQSIGILINKKYLKKDIKKLFLKLKDYLVIDIRSDVDLNNKANLYNVLEYLEKEQLDKFIYEDYLAYRLKQSADKYFND
ncbi:MAG: hypothetical protein IJX78_03415 [Bacilli bacterium]|nr:hypothetical protein [Bacilli bacterium]